MARSIAEGVQKLAKNVMEADSPSDILMGTVDSVSPLKITCGEDEKIALGPSQLLLTTLVCDFDVSMTVNHETENGLDISVEGVNLKHRHAYKGKKTFTIHLGLEAGEKVLLLRQKGGQQFVVLDRLRG